MKKKNTIKVFEQKQVRAQWNEEEEKWYISIIDVIEVLTETDRPRKYWNDLKTKLKKEGSQLSEKIGQLKMNESQIYCYLIRIIHRPLNPLKGIFLRPPQTKIENFTIINGEK